MGCCARAWREARQIRKKDDLKFSLSSHAKGRVVG